MKNAPKKIYLWVDPEEGDDFDDQSDVSWSNSPSDHCLEYRLVTEGPVNSKTELKVGDRVKIINNTSNHDFYLGQIVEVLQLVGPVDDDDDELEGDELMCIGIGRENDGYNWSVRITEIQRI